MGEHLGNDVWAFLSPSLVKAMREDGYDVMGGRMVEVRKSRDRDLISAYQELVLGSAGRLERTYLHSKTLPCSRVNLSK